MFKFGGVEGKEGGQEGENKVQGQSKPRLWFPVCPGIGVFPSFRARVLLVPLLRITINIINNGCAPHNPKVQRYLATEVSYVNFVLTIPHTSETVLYLSFSLLFHLV